MQQKITRDTLKGVSRKEPILLNWEEKDNKIVIILPEDEDRFFLAVDDAIHACKAFDSATAFNKQFTDLLNKLAAWIDEHESKLFKAFLTIRDANLLFLFIHNTNKYDDELEDALTELDIEVAQDSNFNKIKLSVLSLPRTGSDSINSFLDLERALVFKHGR